MLSVRREEFDEEVNFGAKTYDVKLVIQLLKAIRFKDNAIFYCTSEGIKVSVEDMKCIQANSYLESSLFDEYKINKKPDEDFVKFTVNLAVLLDCLNILYNSTSSGLTALIMSYKGEGSPIKLLMEDSGIITDCKIRTLTTEPVLNFNFDCSRSINKVVFFSESFKEVLADVDTTSDLLQITITSQPPEFKLTTDGHGLLSETDVPCDSQMVDAFYCNAPCKHSYRLAHIKPALKPLPGSLKVSIQVNESGILCLQYMIVDEEGRTCFVEYFCLPVYKLSGDEMDGAGDDSRKDSNLRTAQEKWKRIEKSPAPNLSQHSDENSAEEDNGGIWAMANCKPEQELFFEIIGGTEDGNDEESSFQNLRIYVI